MKIIIENITALKIILQCVAKNDVRYYLNGALFSPSKQVAVSTDGHMLAVAKIITESDGVDRDLIISFKDRTIPPKTSSFVIFDDHAICFDMPGGIGERLKIIPIEIITGDYPAYEKVMNSAKPNMPMDTQLINPDLLSRLVQPIKKDKIGVRLNFKGAGEAIHVKFTGAAECVDAFVMPMRDDDNDQEKAA